MTVKHILASAGPEAKRTDRPEEKLAARTVVVYPCEHLDV